MYTFGKTSQNKLNTCHKDLQTIMTSVLDKFDLTIVCGLRTDEEQLKLYKQGKSKLNGIADNKSKHQSNKDGVSMAVDIIDCKLKNPWKNDALLDWSFVAGYVMARAEQLFKDGKITHKLRWGGKWDKDHIQDNSFKDMPHFELIELE